MASASLAEFVGINFFQEIQCRMSLSPEKFGLQRRVSSPAGARLALLDGSHSAPARQVSGEQIE